MISNLWLNLIKFLIFSFTFATKKNKQTNNQQIKFLKTKEGTAMVQMGDAVAVERCVQHLNNIPIGTTGKIQIAFSKQNFLSEVINPFLLPDHTPSFKEYTGSKNNRFLSPAQASKNRIQPPSKVSDLVFLLLSFSFWKWFSNVSFLDFTFLQYTTRPHRRSTDWHFQY